MTLPFSQACENNKLPILECIRRHLIDIDHVFEIGSGTGQHAEFYTQQLPHVTWQASDRQENLDGLNQRLHLCDSDRLPSAIEFDVELSTWPSGLRCVYSANTAHIMPWPITQKMVIGVAQNLLDNGLFILYGPFNYNGKFTSESNANFDLWLKERGAHQGIRDFEAVNQLAVEHGLFLLEDYAMPANNRLLVWRKG